MFRFNAVYEKHGDEWVASVIEVPGALSQGKTLNEARENLRDAIHDLLIERQQATEADIAEASEVVREVLELDFPFVPTNNLTRMQTVNLCETNAVPEASTRTRL